MVPGAADADYSTLDDHRLRRLADQRGRAGPQRRHARVQVLAGLRAHRDDRGDRQPGARGPRPRPVPTATGCARAARPARASSCASSIPTPATTSRPATVGEIWVRSPAGDEGLLEQRRRHARGRSTTTAGSAPATPATSTTDGYLYIHDRVKDMIVSGGENVYPAEVENVLMSHPAIADVAVIGVPHEKWGETAKAMVVRRRGRRRRRRRRSSSSAGSTWPSSSARRASTSSTPCRATRAARC